MNGLLQRLIWRLPEDLTPSWQFDASVDVLVLGGGVQGLCHLATLSTRGYETALLTDVPVGEGATTHWNGVLETGYDDPEPARRRAVEDDWLAYLDENDLPHDSEWYALTRGRTGERLASAWADAGYPFESGEPGDLPVEWQDGDLFEGEAERRVHRIEEYATEKPALVASLIGDHGDRVVTGDLVDVAFRDGSIDAVSVDLATEGTARLDPDHVVVAAGGRSHDVLETVADVASGDGVASDRLQAGLEPVSRSGEHLLAVRAPRGALPEVSAHVLPRGLTVAVTTDATGEGIGTVTWYVHSETFPAAVEEDSEDFGRIDPTAVGAAFSELFSLVPAVRERAERENSGVEFGVFAGVDVDVAGERTHLTKPVEGVSNLSVSVSEPETAWLAAEATGDLVAESVAPSDEGSWVPADVAEEDVPDASVGTRWLDWEELVVRYPEADPLSDQATSPR